MHTASSAKRTCRASASAWEWTATVGMPSSRQARMMRIAISPRLATRTFWNIATRGASGFLYSEEVLAELHALAVLDQYLRDGTRVFGLDLVHQFHGFDDAQGLARLDLRALLDEGFGARGG